MFVRWQVAGITLQKVESSLRPGRPCHCIMLELAASGDCASGLPEAGHGRYLMSSLCPETSAGPAVPTWKSLRDDVCGGPGRGHLAMVVC